MFVLRGVKFTKTSGNFRNIFGDFFQTNYFEVTAGAAIVVLHKLFPVFFRRNFCKSRFISTRFPNRAWLINWCYYNVHIGVMCSASNGSSIYNTDQHVVSDTPALLWAPAGIQRRLDGCPSCCWCYHLQWRHVSQAARWTVHQCCSARILQVVDDASFRVRCGSNS